jgi:hypothetical protein
MILDQFPAIRALSDADKLQLAEELYTAALEPDSNPDADAEVVLHPELLAAIEERVAYNRAHPEEVYTMEQVAARLAELKKRIAARKAHA